LPSEYDRVVSKKCFKACKEKIDKMNIEPGLFSGPMFEMSGCYEACVREQKENDENNN
jgi:hypothetical protein